jgi:hypothetical protein
VAGRRNSPPGEGDGVYDRFVPVDAPDYELVDALESYQCGIERLLEGTARFRVCLLCAEDPSHCHRRLLITRTLVRRGVEVRHIRGNGTVESADNLRAREQGGQLTLLADAKGARKRRRT